jgi:A/G-specific adenine glycosylase
MAGTTLVPPAEPSRRDAAREALLRWFRANARAYPWRGADRDPWPVLVSEVMLQQTQAARVAVAFPVFLRRFPSPRALADASRAEVLRAWAGLGYNRRAVSLHRAAVEIVRAYGGDVPADAATLGELPGIGAYTAAAVASIAFGVPVPAIDTNVRKVIARLAFGVEPHEVVDAEIRRVATAWLDPAAPGDWNQAVMDLGREICRPMLRCDVCPIAAACRFRVARRAAPRTSARTGRAQPVFEGSMRQVRGGVVRELLRRDRAAAIGAIAAALAQPVDRVTHAVDALEREGLVERTPAGRVRLSRER